MAATGLATRAARALDDGLHAGVELGGGDGAVLLEAGGRAHHERPPVLITDLRLALGIVRVDDRPALVDPHPHGIAPVAVAVEDLDLDRRVADHLDQLVGLAVRVHEGTAVPGEHHAVGTAADVAHEPLLLRSLPFGVSRDDQGDVGVLDRGTVPRLFPQDVAVPRFEADLPELLVLAHVTLTGAEAPLARHEHEGVEGAVGEPGPVLVPQIAEDRPVVPVAVHEVAVGEQCGGGSVPATDIFDEESALAEAVGDRAQGHDAFLEAVAGFLAVEADQGDDAGLSGLV